MPASGQVEWVLVRKVRGERALAAAADDRAKVFALALDADWD
jgi:hypothetical protein